MHSSCDGLIAVGGGSAIDCAKGVAIAATHDGPLKTYATIEGGSPLITDRAAPLIAVPTTSGTGSEVARGAILILDDHRKLGFPFLEHRAAAAICDPGADAGPAAQADGGHRHGCRRALHGNLHVGRLQPAGRRHRAGRPGAGLGLHRACHGDGSDREARLNLMSASMQGAMAFQKGLGCVHSA
jgi:4-hydroxybutyrate dehydrogenase